MNYQDSPRLTRAPKPEHAREDFYEFAHSLEREYREADRGQVWGMARALRYSRAADPWVAMYFGMELDSGNEFVGRMDPTPTDACYQEAATNTGYDLEGREVRSFRVRCACGYRGDCVAYALRKWQQEADEAAAAEAP